MRYGKKIKTKLKIKSDKTFQNNFERISTESNFEKYIVLLKKIEPCNILYGYNQQIQNVFQRVKCSGRLLKMS